MNRRSLISLFALPGMLAQSNDPPSFVPSASTTLDHNGTEHIVRAVPVPKTLSPEAQALLATGKQWAPDGWTPESAEMVKRARSVYPVAIDSAVMAGVKVKVITPANGPRAKQRRVLINLHGGGFTSDSGSLLESIPIASLTGTKVIAVDYRLAPKFPFPAAVEDAVAVYKEVAKTHQANNIAVYGTSAGAILTAEMTVQLRKSGLPSPAALGFFSGFADFARNGDSRAFFGVNGLIGFKPSTAPSIPSYIGSHDPRNPVLSPIYADLAGFPPTLCMTGTRDLLLSGTSDFHRALLRAGVDAHLIVFDAMPHAHWYSFDLPESQEALKAQANFLDRRLA